MMRSPIESLENEELRAKAVTEQWKKQTRAAHAEFLNMARQQFNIGSIYYPGSSFDDILEDAFPTRSITYLDLRHKYEGGRDYIRGNFERSPFRDESFDAAFYQDIHANQEQMAEIIRTVKKGGVIIHSRDICEILEGKKILLGMPSVSESTPSFASTDLSVFVRKY